MSDNLNFEGQNEINKLHAIKQTRQHYEEQQQYRQQESYGQPDTLQKNFQDKQQKKQASEINDNYKEFLANKYSAKENILKYPLEEKRKRQNKGEVKKDFVYNTVGHTSKTKSDITLEKRERAQREYNKSNSRAYKPQDRIKSLNLYLSIKKAESIEKSSQVNEKYQFLREKQFDLAKINSEIRLLKDILQVVEDSTLKKELKQLIKEKEKKRDKLEKELNGLKDTGEVFYSDMVQPPEDSEGKKRKNTKKTGE